MLTFEQIENAFPESEINFIDGYGKDCVNPQWLHEFARAIELLANQEKDAEISQLKAMTEGQREVITDLEDRLQNMRASYHANMIRAFPHKSHEEISAEIDRTLQPSQSQVSNATLPITLNDISELIGIAQFLKSQAHWEAQAGSRVLAEITKRLNDALQSIPADTKGGE